MFRNQVTPKRDEDSVPLDDYKREFTRFNDPKDSAIEPKRRDEIKLIITSPNNEVYMYVHRFALKLSETLSHASDFIKDNVLSYDTDDDKEGDTLYLIFSIYYNNDTFYLNGIDIIHFIHVYIKEGFSFLDFLIYENESRIRNGLIESGLDPDRLEVLKFTTFTMINSKGKRFKRTVCLQGEELAGYIYASETIRLSMDTYDNDVHIVDNLCELGFGFSLVLTHCFEYNRALYGSHYTHAIHNYCIQMCKERNDLPTHNFYYDKINELNKKIKRATFEKNKILEQGTSSSNRRETGEQTIRLRQASNTIRRLKAEVEKIQTEYDSTKMIDKTLVNNIERELRKCMRAESDEPKKIVFTNVYIKDEEVFRRGIDFYVHSFNIENFNTRHPINGMME